MSELPKGWRRIRIGDACRLVNGRAFKPTDWTAAGLPIVRIQNLNNPDAAYNRYSGAVEPRYLIDSGELLFAWSGTPGTSFGAHLWDRGPAVLNQHIFRILDYAHHFDRVFLKHAINDRLVHLIGEAHGGAGLAHVTKPKFEATEIVLPPLDEQRRIVAKLDAIQEKSRRAREALDAVPPLLDKLRQSILAAAFRGDLTKDWRTQHPKVEPAEKLLERIRRERRLRWEEAELAKLHAKGKAPKDDRWKQKYVEPKSVDASELPELPAGWCWASLDEVIYESKIGLVRSSEEQSGRGTPYVRMQNYDLAGRWDLEPVTRVTVTEAERATYQLLPGDILLNTRNSAELVGKTAVWAGAAEVHVYNNNLMRLRSVNTVPSSWIGHYAASQGFRARLSERVSATTSVAAIYARDLFAMAIPVAPCEEALSATRMMDEADRRVQSLEQQANRMWSDSLTLDRAVLAKAFRGEL